MTPIPLTRPVTPPPPLQPFGKYLLVRKLAEGGMAELFLAKQVGTEGFERDVVIKCMLGHLSRHPEFVGMFLDEARLAARLFHPNIVQMLDLGVAEGRHYLCMEYLPGEDLEAVIAMAAHRGEPVPVALATRIILSACEGLEFAHGHTEGGRPVNLVHRDVSPSNILVTYQGTVKVVDFGIAKASSKLVHTQPGTLKGKLGYMSPEQARGEPLDARSDLFSLGVTFYELLTGQRVFQRDSELGVMLALMEQPVPSARQVRPDVPEALDRIVMRALARRREDRYQSAAELRLDLESFLVGISSVPGGAQLGGYLRRLFGEERARHRTQLATLEELTAAGAVVAPTGDTGAEPTLVRTPLPAVQTAPALEPTFISSPPTPASPSAPPPAPRAGRGLRRVVLGALGAVLLLGAGAGALVVVKPGLLARAGAPAVGVEGASGVPAPAAVVTPVPAVTAAPQGPPLAPGGREEPAQEEGTAVAPAAEPVAAAGASSSDAPPPGEGLPGGEERSAGEDTASREPLASGEVGAPDRPAAVEASGTAVARRPARRVPLLDETAIHAVLRRHGRAFVACAQRHRTELPADGKVRLEFTIRNSGEVAHVKTTDPALQPSALAACLTRQLRALRFPRNRNTPEMAYAFPMGFSAPK